MIRYRLAPSPCHRLSSFSKIRKRLSVASTATTMQTMVSITMLSTPFRSAIHCSPGLLSLDTHKRCFAATRLPVAVGFTFQGTRRWPRLCGSTAFCCPPFVVPILHPWKVNVNPFFNFFLKKSCIAWASTVSGVSVLHPYAHIHYIYKKGKVKICAIGHPPGSKSENNLLSSGRLFFPSILIV